MGTYSYVSIAKGGAAMKHFLQGWALCHMMAAVILSAHTGVLSIEGQVSAYMDVNLRLNQQTTDLTLDDILNDVTVFSNMEGFEVTAFDDIELHSNEAIITISVKNI